MVGRVSHGLSWGGNVAKSPKSLKNEQMIGFRVIKILKLVILFVYIVCIFYTYLYFFNLIVYLFLNGPSHSALDLRQMPFF